MESTFGSIRCSVLLSSASFPAEHRICFSLAWPFGSLTRTFGSARCAIDIASPGSLYLAIREILDFGGARPDLGLWRSSRPKALRLLLSRKSCNFAARMTLRATLALNFQRGFMAIPAPDRGYT